MDFVQDSTGRCYYVAARTEADITLTPNAHTQRFVYTAHMFDRLGLTFIGRFHDYNRPLMPKEGDVADD